MSQPIEPRRPTVLDPTYARPEPWFVGSGRGLMIAVLSLVAIVVALRGVTTWWALEDAWRWWHNRPPSVPVSSVPAAAVAPANRVLPLPTPPVPPADPKLARRALSGDVASAFIADDYPMEALRADEQGRTVASLVVGPNGVPQRCTVRTSSGSAALDQRTCEVALARIRYKPARDRLGRPIAATTTLPVRWRLPEQ